MKVNFFTNTYRFNTTFSSREDTRRKSDAFMDELIKKGASGNLSIEKIHQLTKKYLPEIEVKTISPKSKKHADNGGIYQSYIGFYKKPPSAQIDRKVLKLKEMPDKRDYIEYLATIAHEMTHALQAADKDIGDDRLITESLLGVLPVDDWGNQTDIGYAGFVEIENKMLKPLILAYKEIKFYNNELRFLDMRINKKRFKTALNSHLDEIKKKNPSADMNFIRKLICLQAMNEFDAYRADEIFKKKMNANYEHDDFIPNLYLCLAKCLNVTGVE